MPALTDRPSAAQGNLGGPPPPVLDHGEELIEVLRGIGSVMFLTTDRIIVARDGVERRPRTGIQSVALDEVRHIRLERGSGPSARVVVVQHSGHEAISMFVESRSIEAAHALIAAARPLIARRRRAIGDGPSDPPLGA